MSRLRRARTYTSISARSDGNNARICGGMHDPSTVEISDANGEAVAAYVNLNSMQRLHPRTIEPLRAKRGVLR